MGGSFSTMASGPRSGDQASHSTSRPSTPPARLGHATSSASKSGRSSYLCQNLREAREAERRIQRRRRYSPALLGRRREFLGAKNAGIMAQCRMAGRQSYRIMKFLFGRYSTHEQEALPSCLIEILFYCQRSSL